MGSLTLAACSLEAAEVEVVGPHTRSYAPDLVLDLWSPSAEGGPFPAVVLVHGGGFSSGDRHQLAELAEQLAARGVVAAAIDYRLSQGSWFPTDELVDPDLRAAAGRARDDAIAAVTWLREGSARNLVDPENIAVAGYSAGGITAIEVASHMGGTRGSGVVGAVSIAGAGIELDALDGGDPPLLLMHGTDDVVVPVTLADRTCAAAKRVGMACTVQRFEGVGHDLPAVRGTEIVQAIVGMLGGAP